MLQVCKATEIASRIPDVTGAKQLLRSIKTKGIEVLAHCCIPAQGDALSLMVTDQPQQAQAVLEHAGLECQTSPVVLVRTPPQTALAAQLGMRLTAARIGIRYCYTTRLKAKCAHVVFKTTDDDHAIRVLQACQKGGDQPAPEANTRPACDIPQPDQINDRLIASGQQPTA